MEDGISRFSCPGYLSTSDMITVNILVGCVIFCYLSFSRRFRYRKSNLHHPDRVSNRKPPSFIKYDGMTRTVLKMVFGPVYY